MTGTLQKTRPGAPWIHFAFEDESAGDEELCALLDAGLEVCDRGEPFQLADLLEDELPGIVAHVGALPLGREADGSTIYRCQNCSATWVYKDLGRSWAKSVEGMTAGGDDFAPIKFQHGGRS